MSRTTDSIHVYPIKVLPITRSHPRYPLYGFNRHVVVGLYRGGALLGVAAVPGNERV